MSFAGKFFYTGLAFLGLITIAATLSFLGWVVLQMTLSDGKIDYCYTSVVEETGKSSFRVHGHRSWRSDDLIATFPSINDAEAWRAHQCPR